MTGDTYLIELWIDLREQTDVVKIARSLYSRYILRHAHEQC